MDDLEGTGRRVKSDDSDKKMIDCDEYSLVQGRLIEILISFFLKNFYQRTFTSLFSTKAIIFNPNQLILELSKLTPTSWISNK